MQEETKQLETETNFKGEIIRAQPFDEYAKIDAVNAGALEKIISTTPKKFKWDQDHPDEETSDALEFGKLFHLAMLEPENFKKKVVTQPKFDKRTNVGKAAFASWMAQVEPGAIICKEAWLADLTGMMNSTLSHPRASGLLRTAVTEITYTWQDTEFGMKCKARADAIGEDRVIIDLKSSRDITPRFVRNYLKFSGGALRASHYLSGAKTTKLAKHEAYLFLFIEKTPPYDLILYSPDESILSIGEIQRKHAMNIFAKCKRLNEWPGYDQTIRQIGFEREDGEELYRFTEETSY